MRFTGKKGQLTVFIIIGIVLLFSTALIIYIKNNIATYIPPSTQLESVPTELQPMQKYVTDCVTYVTTDAITKVGMQGGYANTSSIVINDLDPTSAEGISFSPNSPIKIPYWYYMKSPNLCTDGCQLASKMLPLKGQNSIETQISDYVSEHLPDCTANFIQFNKQFSVSQGTVQTTTTIVQTGVYVQVTYPLTITYTQGGRIDTMSKFSTQIPIDLGKFYNLALEITNKEKQTGFLTMLTLNLISTYSGIDPQKLPPFGDWTFLSYTSQFWMQTDVQKELQSLLTDSVSLLRATGTLNYQGNLYTGTNTFDQGLYSFFILPMSSTYTVNAQFTYLPWWPIYSRVTPSDGQMIRPDSVGNLDPILSTLGINQYRFSYDVSYPVLVSLTDPTAFNGKGYTFEFALESNTRHNADMNSSSNITMPTYGAPDDSFVCDPGNFQSGNVTIIVDDAVTHGPVDGASVFFSLGSRACSIGITQVANGKTIINTKMPLGVGTLIVSKQGYLSKAIPFGTESGKSDSVKADLDKYYNINVSIVRVPIVKSVCINNNCTWTPANAVAGLTNTEEAIILLQRVKEDKEQEDVVGSADIKGSGSMTSSMTLAPGQYQITGTLLDNQLTIIPKEIMKVCSDACCAITGGIPGICDKKSEVINATSFNPFPKGGISLLVNITAAELQSKQMTIYLFSVPDGYIINSNGVTDLTHEDLDQVGTQNTYSQEYPSLVQPSFT